MLPERLEQRLKEILAEVSDLEKRLGDPEVARDHVAWGRLRRELAPLAPTAGLFREFLRHGADLTEARGILAAPDGDEEMRTLAEEQAAEAERERERLVEEIKQSLVAEDEDDRRDAIVEIRAGAGGEEAALWAGDLFRMYGKFAERRGWKTEVIDASRAEQGGLKEVRFSLRGNLVFHDLRFESGVHRVQRVPKTEAQGRIHTSTATVAVLPEVEEVDVEIKDSDLEIHTMRAGGPGGQNVNKTSSAVRIIHLPTGLVVKCQSDPSQHKNRATALRELRARLYALEQEKADRARRENRRSQIGTGDRSEKIRTYNFKESRVTDHRIGLTLHDLEGVLEGDLTEMLAALHAADREERLGRL